MSSDERDGSFEETTEYCLRFVTEQLEKHRNSDMNTPLFVGLNGVQGCGKTTLASSLAQRLSQAPYSLPTIVFSIDDLYLSHKDQKRLAEDHPSNPLVQHRGQFSTHDISLGRSLLADLKQGKESKLPSFDKSEFGGEGDRVAENQWKIINTPGMQRPKIVILEGWCVGFRALSDKEVLRRWQEATSEKVEGTYVGRLASNTFDNISFVNQALKQYDDLTDHMDSIIHIDAADPVFVYRWRMEQEVKLRIQRGSGMSDDQVVKFVDGYYPAYELYTDGLRDGVFATSGRQLRLVINKDRRVERLIGPLAGNDVSVNVGNTLTSICTILNGNVEARRVVDTLNHPSDLLDR
ncbi:uncharacterized protein KY384_003230 [Bacidia gigantensis]|uniref:uncharacterized protein n=1 Tax=Bacidia gigantensis TaxID=2732470 RepID=UPI001D03C303|nr:uncharacterized protein KY384_003230 [Bacidia gigantensis]KAG8531600.1 hypothetical protein KY384_003230 [Bacidia gigantensis]